MLQTLVADEVEQVDLTREAFGAPETVIALGKLALASLEAVGSCTFILDEQGKVRLVNHFHVYMSAEAAYPPEGVEPTFVRPILTQKKPQYVAIREDGSLWEVEYRAQKTDGS